MRNKKQSRFNGCNIPFYPIISDSRVSCKARGLYFSIVFTFGESQVSYTDIKAKVKEGRDGVYVMLSELEEYGYISKEKQESVNGRFSIYYYTFHISTSKDNYEQPDINCYDAYANPNNNTIYMPISEPITEKVESVAVESVVEEKPKKPTKSIEDRAKEFGNSLVEYLNNPYDKVMIRNFYDYWTEPNRSGKKMRFELEKTWCTSRRLKTWYNRSKEYGSNRQISSAETREHDAATRRQGVENLVASILSGCR